MQFVPTSISVSLGEDVTIPCNFHKKPNEDVTVFWFRDGISNETYRMVELESNTQNLTIANVNKTDRGFYQCRVNVGNRNHLSCGTYLRVKGPPLYLFFNVSEATKNRLITAEGIILLLCAIIPGTFLLYRKRLENVNSMSFKEAEGENLYEGLNLEDCSMYEDISRGLQATYEDVGTLRATVFQLEKP
ncbi:B-cell antigen receptor complex-associated protein alpha chain isoform X3 [Hyla sarda]|nr:B-cell antigen receptor complex-associated protein alpha chain isoform X3 [Hyla sarda]XP_056399758.1 B-cell antigen receptor complex-associated protein alpha chain isoform X3 [Hyla sarda]XP_056399759.1 B-cell antigen receptor complex-associated protein alpha chain isoform X3 [Hyla sarda]XP_056399760.1 B-cell antigen receptor complex-associated protein alpha chain isoform X3 [Hyla sarda]